MICPRTQVLVVAGRIQLWAGKLSMLTVCFASHGERLVGVSRHCKCAEWSQTARGQPGTAAGLSILLHQERHTWRPLTSHSHTQGHSVLVYPQPLSFPFWRPFPWKCPADLTFREVTPTPTSSLATHNQPPSGLTIQSQTVKTLLWSHLIIENKVYSLPHPV